MTTIEGENVMYWVLIEIRDDKQREKRDNYNRRKLKTSFLIFLQIFKLLAQAVIYFVKHMFSSNYKVFGQK